MEGKAFVLMVLSETEDSDLIRRYGQVPVKKQVVRVKLTKTDSSMDPEDLKEAILQQLNQRLEDQGLSGDVKLRWVKQPDGRILHKEEEEEEEEEESCNLK
ncbi:uncharacterized protein LOC144543496 isoform X2 [Centroberyx gerrardi]